MEFLAKLKPTLSPIHHLPYFGILKWELSDPNSFCVNSVFEIYCDVDSVPQPSKGTSNQCLSLANQVSERLV